MAVRPFLQYRPTLGSRTYLDEAAVIIGNVIIGDDSSIWPFASIRGDVHQIKIGDRTNIQDCSVLHATHAGEYAPNGFSLQLGNEITVGHHVTLHGCTLHDRCLIGMGSIVLDNVVVESDVMVGAGSLVPPGKVLTSGFLWLGTPVIKKRPLTKEEIAFIRYSAEHYVKLKNNYLKVEK